MRWGIKDSLLNTLALRTNDYYRHVDVKAAHTYSAAVCHGECPDCRCTWPHLKPTTALSGAAGRVNKITQQPLKSAVIL